MTIIYVGAFRFPTFDAAAARVLNNARCLRYIGHSVEFISWGGRYVNTLFPLGSINTYDGFKYTITRELDLEGSFVQRLLNRINRGGRTFRQLAQRNDIDLIISYNPDLLFNLRLISFTRRRGIKYANDLTEWSDKYDLRLIERLTNSINLRIVTKTIQNRIVISSYFDHYYHYGNNIVVPPLVDLSEEKWRESSSNEGESHPLTFIYAGNPARKDYLHHIINSIQLLLEKGLHIRLLILGVSREQYLRKYSALIKSLNLNSSIAFVGRVPQDEVPSYYHKSDYMVLLREPNRKAMAGFPTKFSEAFASGVPVVANLTSDLGLYLKDGETGFVVVDNTESSLAKTIERIYSLPSSVHKTIRERVRVISRDLDYHCFSAKFEHFISHIQ